MQPIPLASLLPSGFDPATCKLHCAVFNGQKYPIEPRARADPRPGRQVTDFGTCLSVGDLVPIQASGHVTGAHRTGIHIRWSTGTWTVVVDQWGDDYPWGVRLAHLPRGSRPGDLAARAAGTTLTLGDLRIDTTHAPTRGLDRWADAGATKPSLLQDDLTSLDATVLQTFHDLLLRHPTSTVLVNEATDRILGAGTGLTPFGDDLLVGALAAIWTAGLPVPNPASIDQLERRTSGLSAWLVLMGTRGRFGRHLQSLATAGLHGTRAQVSHAVTPLLALGASSGRGMALGALLTLDTLVAGYRHRILPDIPPRLTLEGAA